MNGHFHSNSVLRLTPPEVPKKGTFLSFNFGRRQLYNDNENFYKCSVGVEKWMLFLRLFSLLLNWAVKDSSRCTSWLFSTHCYQTPAPITEELAKQLCSPATSKPVETVVHAVRKRCPVCESQVSSKFPTPCLQKHVKCSWENILGEPQVGGTLDSPSGYLLHHLPDSSKLMMTTNTNCVNAITKYAIYPTRNEPFQIPNTHYSNSIPFPLPFLLG